MRVLRAYRDTTDRSDGIMTFVASTEGVKRDGKDLASTRWNLDNYRRNPVFLWAHDYMGAQLPIGRADVEVQGRRLIANVTFDDDDDFAKRVKAKYEKGFLNAVSVGWDENDDGYDLLDVSAVPVPGDPDALLERQFRALSALRDESPDPPDTEPEPVRGVDVLRRAIDLIQHVINVSSAVEDDDVPDVVDDTPQEDKQPTSDVLAELSQLLHDFTI